MAARHTPLELTNRQVSALNDAFDTCCKLCSLPAFASRITANQYCFFLERQPKVSRLFYKRDCYVSVLPCLPDAKEVAEAHYVKTWKQGIVWNIAYVLALLAFYGLP
jgi:hypothetical protein